MPAWASPTQVVVIGIGRITSGNKHPDVHHCSKHEMSGTYLMLLSLTLSGLLGGGHWEEKAEIGQVALSPRPLPPPRAWDLSGRGRAGGTAVRPVEMSLGGRRAAAAADAA